MPGSRFGFGLDGIAHILKDRHLRVPIYQRSFAWDDEKVDDYWNDLSSSFSSTGTDYFLGTIVLAGSEDAGYAIIDGQQRLATTAVFVAAIRDAYERLGDSDAARSVQGDYLASWDRRQRQAVPHLELNSDDDAFFRSLIIERGATSPPDPSHPSHELLVRASAKLGQYLADDLARVRTADQLGHLHNWLDYLVAKVQVMGITVPDEADAYLIFETLNDRGADLTIADLLKNYLFGKAGRRLNPVRDGWTRSLGLLEMSSEDTTFTTFLRHYWSSLKGFVRERDLYKSIKDTISSEEDAVTFITGLQEAARLYAALLNAGNEYWATLGGRSKENAETLLRLRLEQNRPLLLSAMLNWEDQQIRELLRAMVAWSVRGMVVGGIGAGRTESAFSAGAAKIEGGEITTKNELFTQLLTIIPGDDEFKASFAIARESRPRLARYLLLSLEQTARGDDEPELVPNDNEEQVNLEHVLPRTPESAWPTFNPEQQRSYLHRLGNLVLLTRRRNIRLGNRPFSEKRPILQESELVLTRLAAEPVEWSPEEVTKRQVAMAEIAVRTWPRNP